MVKIPTEGVKSPPPTTSPVDNPPITPPAVETGGPTTSPPTDAVEPNAPPAPTANTTELQRQIVELQKDRETERLARVAREEQEAKDAKKPGFLRTVIEIFDLFNRFFNPLWNLASALFRICRIGYNLLTGKKVEWKNEGIKLAAELGGAALQIFMPGVGGIIGGALAAGVQGYMNWKNNDSEIIGGANKLIDKADVEYGIKQLALKTADIAKDAYGGTKKLVTGKDDTPVADDGVRPLKPAEAPKDVYGGTRKPVTGNDDPPPADPGVQPLRPAEVKV
jgi:hypothetical protein